VRSKGVDLVKAVVYKGPFDVAVEDVADPGVGHERGDPGAVDAVALESAAGRLDDPSPGRCREVSA